MLKGILFSMATTPDTTRFAFGKNWAFFLKCLDEKRIQSAQDSLMDCTGLSDFKGKSFIDVGSGSGLFSLAAHRLGAERIHSFDYDPESVACTRELKNRYFPDSAHWTIEQASVLDEKYITGLGTFDIVYCFGVLHHTGDLWKALEHVSRLPKPGGILFLMLYNKGRRNVMWKRIKKTYNQLPNGLRFLVWVPAFIYIFGDRLIYETLQGDPFKVWKKYKERGMSTWHDFIDWVGGYPYEVSTPHDVFNFLYGRGFSLFKLFTCGGGIGGNTFSFKKNPD